MSTYLQTVSSSMTDKAVITPASGKKIHLCYASVKNPTSSKVEIKLSGDYFIVRSTTTSGSHHGCQTGTIDESVTVTAEPTVELDLHYDEVS